MHSFLPSGAWLYPEKYSIIVGLYFLMATIHFSLAYSGVYVPRRFFRQHPRAKSGTPHILMHRVRSSGAGCGKPQAWNLKAWRIFNCPPSYPAHSFTLGRLFMSFDAADVLLVEDNRGDEMLSMVAFAKRNITQVHVVRDGAEALEYIFCTGNYSKRAFENPNVILLDLKLPKVDGIEVLHQIRNDPRTRAIPVVVLTSSNQQRDIVQAYRLGVNSYIIKPVDFEQLGEIVERLGNYWLKQNRQPHYVVDPHLERSCQSTMPTL